MANVVAGSSIYLMPGMSVKLACPVNYKNHNGFHPWPMTKPLPSTLFPDRPDSSSLYTINGFIVEDPESGELTDANEPMLSVIYTHRKVAENAIWFFSNDLDIKTVVNVISVPIHDHSSIVQGGPAYGTYFDDDVER